MKKLIIVAAACLLAVAATQAQTPGGVAKDSTATAFHQKHGFKKHGHGHFQGKGAHRGGEMAGVKLTDEQRKQAHAIAESYHKQATALKAQDNITMGEYKKQMAALQANRKQQMSQLLTSEQKQQITQHQTQRLQQGKAHAEARMAKMKSHLNLSDEQVAKLKQQRSDLQAQVKAIHENQSLDEAAKKQQVHALMQQQKDNFKSVLTQEQLDKLHTNPHKKGDVK